MSKYTLEVFLVNEASTTDIAGVKEHYVEDDNLAFLTDVGWGFMPMREVRWVIPVSKGDAVE